MLTEYFSLSYSVTHQLSLSNRKLKTCSHSHHAFVTPATIKKPPHQKPKISRISITIHYFTTLNYVAL